MFLEQRQQYSDNDDEGNDNQVDQSGILTKTSSTVAILPESLQLSAGTLTIQCISLHRHDRTPVFNSYTCLPRWQLTVMSPHTHLRLPIGSYVLLGLFIYSADLAHAEPPLPPPCSGLPAMKRPHAAREKNFTQNVIAYTNISITQYR